MTNKPITQPAKTRCEQCGENFESSRSGQRFCSQKCRAKNYHLHNREKIRELHKAWEARNPRARKELELKVCRMCPTLFETRDPQKKFCSEKCRDADHYKRHGDRIRANRKRWTAENREKARAQVRRHHAKYRDVLNAKTKARYAEKKRRLLELEGLATAHVGQLDTKPRGKVGATAKRSPEFLEEAISLYAKLGSWGQVAKKLTYSDWQADHKGAADRLRLDVNYYIKHRKAAA